MAIKTILFLGNKQKHEQWRPWLTRLLHVGYDPVKSHLGAHVPGVVDGLPAGLQGKAHLRQLHYCCLIYFWSWGHNTTSVNK